MCFGPFGAGMRTLDKPDSFIAIPLEQDGSRPSLLFSGTSPCILKRSGWVPTVSVLWIWLTMCFGSFHLGCTWLDVTAGIIAIPHEQDGSRPSLLFAGTSACIQKRSRLVPTVSVISFGLLVCFGPFHFIHAWLGEMGIFVHKTAWTRWIPSIHPCLRVLRHVY